VFKTQGIPETAKVVFVSDMFVEHYVGGAELTSEALITSSPLEVYKLRSKDVTMALLSQNTDKFWVFGNFSELNPELIPSIVANIRYSVLEYDYKFCKFRSPEKHQNTTGSPCDCVEQITGKLISAFLYGSMGIWWMSEAQKNIYLDKFPFLVNCNNVVLSSVFSLETLGYIQKLRSQNVNHKKSKWIVLGSNSWIKGAAAAEKWCVDNNKEYEVLWNIPYNELLEKLSMAEGFVYLPEGGDTCPRMVIEAKLLGCQLELNNNVQHKDEEWFATNDIQSINDYLFVSPKNFWAGIKTMMEYKPTISGYTTTMNCVKQQYPFEQCIKSMMNFCKEICVVDGGSTDGTWEILQELAQQNSTIKIKQVVRDWNHPRFAVFDGMQKAEARSMCTQEFCWQMDSDEIVHEDDCLKISNLAHSLPKDASLIALPVIEYWGGLDKVRLDVTPWKWRLSRNQPTITHGIPRELRLTDANGHLYAAPGTDGCDMIDSESFERIPFINFYTQEVDNVRRVALLGNQQALQQYEQWFNAVVSAIPSVFHYSWFDLERKIRLYRDYWTRHWENISGKNYVDSAQSNMMFDVPWSEVTDEMITELASKLKSTGGWIWHQKWNGQLVPWISCKREQPSVMSVSV
jgi:glycosyltransferase involved in cell wall biosynthesis